MEWINFHHGKLLTLRTRGNAYGLNQLSPWKLLNPRTRGNAYGQSQLSPRKLLNPRTRGNAYGLNPFSPRKTTDPQDKRKRLWTESTFTSETTELPHSRAVS